MSEVSLEEDTQSRLEHMKFFTDPDWPTEDQHLFERWDNILKEHGRMFIQINRFWEGYNEKGVMRSVFFAVAILCDGKMTVFKASDQQKSIKLAIDDLCEKIKNSYFP